MWGPSSHSGMKSWLTTASYSGMPHYYVPTRPQIFDFGRSPAYKAALSPEISTLDASKRPRMAGHSQFKNIMHRKGRQDAQKSKLFGKLAREITVAAKLGTPDPNMNPRLRAAIIAAALNDNRNRAASDIRSFFTKSGGNLGETGSVSFMFDRTGIIEYDRSVASDDAVLDAAIEAGADDVISSEGGHEIYASTEGYRDVARALEAKFGEPRKAALIWKPQNTVAVDDETGERLLKLMDLLNEHDDVQHVYANFEVSDALVAKMGG